VELGKTLTTQEWELERVTHAETDNNDSETQFALQEAVANAEKAVAKAERSKKMRDRMASLLPESPALLPEAIMPVELSNNARACAASADQAGTGAGLVPQPQPLRIPVMSGSCTPPSPRSFRGVPAGDEDVMYSVEGGISKHVDGAFIQAKLLHLGSGVLPQKQHRKHTECHISHIFINLM